MLTPALFALVSFCSVAPPVLAQKAVEKEKIEIPAEVVVESGSSRAWALLTCAVPDARGNFKHDLLAGARLDEENVKKLRELLHLGLGVDRRVELVTVLDKLMENGRQAEFVSLFKMVHDLNLTEKDVEDFKDEKLREKLQPLVRHAKRLSKEKNGLLGYDCVRYITFCRYGYGAGFLTEAEAWRRIEPVAKKLQKAYDSWEAAGEIYAIGVDVFERPLAEKTWAVWNALKADEKSPWKSLDWKLKLAPLDKPEPVKKAPEPAGPPPKK